MVLYGPNGSAVRSVRSRPEPNVDTERKVREQLQAMDSLLDIQWFPHAVFNPKHGDFEGRYALVCKWPVGDVRWALFQSGEIQNPVDMLGWFCEDMQDANTVPVALDSITNKVLELLYKCDGTRIPHAKRMAAILEKNDKMKKDRQKDILDQAGEIAKDLHYISGHVEDVTFERIKQDIAKEAKENG